MRAPSRSCFLMVMLMPGLAACSSAQSGDVFDQADKDSITKLMQELIVVYNAKDSAKVTGLFTENGAVMPPNASTVRGSVNVRLYYDKRFAQGASDLKLETGDIVGVGTLAYATGDYWLNMAPPGGEVRRDRGKFMFILRERGGKWLLERLMFSSDFAPETSS
jgi:ketosteroid isomerase-like protein